MRQRVLVLASALVSLVGCFDPGDGTGSTSGTNSMLPPGGSLLTVEDERQSLDDLATSPIELRCRVLDESGAPIAGADVSAQGVEGSTDASGEVVLSLARRNSVLVVRASGYREERRTVWLFRPARQESVTPDPVVMAPLRAGVGRFLFGGDVALGRRFLDPEERAGRGELPADDPDALIQVSDPFPGTRAILGSVQPMVESVDYASANLETVVTDDPSTPDEDNRFVFFTLPDSVRALSAAGFDHVALANNHTYDYGEAGVADTLAAVEAAGLASSGLGRDPTGAFAPHTVTVRDNDYAIASLVSIEGVESRDSTAAREGRGGTADLDDDQAIEMIIDQATNAGQAVIAHLHTGYEYTLKPPDDDYTRQRMQFVADAGASLVIAHHPHVPQGFEFHRGSLVAHSLGNFVFDQERLDTMLGMVLVADMEGDVLHRARAVGTYIDSFVPRRMTGPHQDRFLRRIAWSSAPFGAFVFPWGDEGWIVESRDTVNPSTRTIEVEVTPTDGVAYIDLRPHLRPGESLKSLDSSLPGDAVDFGRDLMWFGHMEDVDVDDDIAEVARWYTTGGSSFPCTRAHRGAIGLCSTRKGSSSSESIIAFRNRIRVPGDKLNEPNKDLTLMLWVKRENAGPVRIEAEHTASFGGKEFGREVLAEIPAGSSDWTLVGADLSLPADTVFAPRDDPFDPVARIENARATRPFVYQSPPPEGSGLVAIDDAAVVAWDPGGDPPATPHPYDFIRLRVSEPQSVAVVLESFAPADVTR